jgi:hypothetical protein
MSDACSITFLGGICNAAIVVVSIAILIWLDSKISHYAHGPDYTMMLVMWIVVIPAAMAVIWVCVQPWAYDWTACNAFLDAKQAVNLQFEHERQQREDDLKWLRQLREKKQ